MRTEVPAIFDHSGKTRALTTTVISTKTTKKICTPATTSISANSAPGRRRIKIVTRAVQARRRTQSMRGTKRDRALSKTGLISDRDVGTG